MVCQQRTCYIVRTRPSSYIVLLLTTIVSFDKLFIYVVTERHTKASHLKRPSFFVTARSEPLNTGSTEHITHSNRRRLLFESSLKQHYHSPSRDIPETTYQTGDDSCVIYKPYPLPTLTALNFHFHKFCWFYELCSNKSTRFLRVELVLMSHDVHVSVRSLGHIKFDISENYNLGSYLNPHIPVFEYLLSSRLTENKDSQLGKKEIMGGMADNYSGADVCDALFEEGNGSKIPKVTKIVHVEQCCWHPSDTDESLQNQNFRNIGKFRIMSVEEQTDCAYFLRLCSVSPVLGRDELMLGIGNESGRQETNETNVSGFEHKQGNDRIKDRFQEMISIYLQTSKHRNNKLSKNEYTLGEGHQDNDPGNFPPIPPSKIAMNKDLVVSMFRHAYDSYMYNAYPASELKPISCKPGSFNLVRLPALTLIDSLDTLLIMGNHTEFARGVERLRLLDKQMRAKTVREKGNDINSNGTPYSILDRFDGIAGGLFAVNQNISVFETNIRVLGGLLSAHQMAMVWMNNTVLMEDIFHEDGSVLIGKVRPKLTREKIFNCKQRSGQFSGRKMSNEQLENLLVESIFSESCEQPGTCVGIFKNESKISNMGNHGQTKFCTDSFWKYDGFLLSLAHDLGKRLLPAFDTKTGIPYGTVNLLYGIPNGETTVASLAGAGTLSIEMELLSRLTGDSSFGKAAKLATRALWARRSSVNLVGKHIDINTGVWVEHLSGIGSNSDSFYEYLIKHYILFPEDEEFWIIFLNMYSGIFKKARLGDWYVDVNMNGGQIHRTVFESLAAFYPGMQVLLGELMSSSRTANSFASVREYTALLPERFDFLNWNADIDGANHPLRPELHETTYFLNAALKDFSAVVSNSPGNDIASSSGWLWSADFSIHAIEELTRTECGYGVIRAVPTQSANTAHDAENLDDEMPSFFLSETLKYLYLSFDPSNILHIDKEREWVFTTEAHPMHHVLPLDSQEVNHTDDLSHKENHDAELSSLKQRVLNILKNQSEANSTINIHSNFERLSREKWTKSTAFKDHVQDVENVVVAIEEDKLGRPNYFDVFGRIMQKTGLYKNESFANFASMSHSRRGKGDGNRLSRTCPNHYNSNGLWIEALSGDELDYTDFFLSYADDDDDESDFTADDSVPQMPAALITSALYGTAYMSRERDINSCSASKSTSGKGAESHYTSTQSINQVPFQSQRIDAGSALGMFDVSIFEQSTGFFVKHANSGESMEVTIFSNQRGNSQKEKGSSASTFVTIDSFQSRKGKGKKDDRLFESVIGFSIPKILPPTSRSSQSRKKLPQKEYQRSVMIADLDGHAFFCEVELRIPIIPADHSQKSKTEEYPGTNQLYETVATFPCLGALYGRTKMSQLIKTGGLEVKAVLRAPKKFDEFGCSETTSDAKENIDEYRSFIQLTRRGKCTFRQKALNQLKRKSKADAMIIINTEKDKIFLMVGNEEEELSGYRSEDEPISVLVSERDGNNMISIVKKYESNLEHSRNEVQAVVRMSQQDLGSDVVTRWPVVNTFSNSKKIQVLASSGWGAVAAQKSDAKSEREWQIMILQHALHK